MIAEEESADAAAWWVARMDAGNWSADDEAALQQWLGEHPAHRGLLLQTHASWLAADRLGDARPAAAPEGMTDDRERGVLPRRLVVAGLAATVAAVVGKLALQTSPLNYATKLGEIRRVPLSDGSVMTINSASALDVRLEEKVRRVDLARGEAWFEVAKDTRRPFVVAAGGIKVRAVGTAFSVRIRGDAVAIIVTEGVVEAWDPGSEVAPARLRAGQIAFVGGQAQVRQVIEEPSSVDRALAWRSGLIDLQGETLAEAVEEFNRYNRRKLVVGDGQVAVERFDGVFRVNDPEGFALVVKNSLDVPVSFEDPTVIRIGN